MTIDELLKKGREMWKERLNLSQIIVCLGKVFGDICRYERNALKDQPTHTDQELKKELGHVILSTIRWCDDLGFKPEECINEAIKSQEQFQK